MTQAGIKGLTLRHPWAFAFQRLSKDVENRTWHPSRQGGRIGMFLALHGGAMPPARGEYWNEIADACSWIRRQGQTEAWEIIWPLLQDGRALCVPGIIAVAQLVDVRQDSPSPWAAQGQHHWCLDVTPLSEPVPHKGAQGLWNLELDALAQVRTLYREALKAKTAAT